jgi:hypothetical protein
LVAGEALREAYHLQSADPIRHGARARGASKNLTRRKEAELDIGAVVRRARRRTHRGFEAAIDLTRGEGVQGRRNAPRFLAPPGWLANRARSEIGPCKNELGLLSRGWRDGGSRALALPMTGASLDADGGESGKDLVDKAPPRGVSVDERSEAWIQFR